MYACVLVCDWVSMCFNCGTRTRSCDQNPVTGDPDLIRICTCYGLDTVKIDSWDDL